jgi:hypothetical protein
VVEADETIIPFRTKNDPVVVPAGRSGVGKMLVAGAVEIDGGKPRRARLKVIGGFGKQELHAFVLGAVAPQTRLVTDDWASYQDIPGVWHHAITLGPMAAHIALPWIHRLFSNLKRWGLASITVCGKPTSSTTSMSSCSASIGAGHGMPPSIPCSASALAPLRPPTTC